MGGGGEREGDMTSCERLVLEQKKLRISRHMEKGA